MYRSYYVKNFDKIENNSFSYSQEKHKELLNYNDNFVKNFVNYIENNEGIISVADILENVFPEIECDIFLSHAHKDNSKVINLANFLEEKYECKVFIDSIFWGNVFDLLRQIDNKCCIIKDSGNYNYTKRNFTTSNLFLILNTALHKMIDKTNYFFFLETKQSTKENQNLISPWIFSELSFATQVRKRNPQKKLFKEKSTFQENFSSESSKIVEFSYPIPRLDVTLTYKDFLKFINGD